jgi:hypothetical protein
MQSWAQHQLGTLSAFSGELQDGLSWLESAELLRDRMGDAAGRLHSKKNAALLRKAPISKKGKKKTGIVWDLTLMSWAMGLIVFVAMSHAFGRSSLHALKSSHTHTHVRAHVASHNDRVSALPAAAQRMRQVVRAAPDAKIP